MSASGHVCIVHCSAGNCKHQYLRRCSTLYTAALTAVLSLAAPVKAYLVSVLLAHILLGEQQSQWVHQALPQQKCMSFATVMKVAPAVHQKTCGSHVAVMKAASGNASPHTCESCTNPDVQIERRLDKEREHAAALEVLPDLLHELDQMPPQARLTSLIQGILAGNIFDWGAKATVDLYHNGTILEIYR